MKINLHIERLILDGVNLGAAERRLLQTGLESELVRLFRGGGVAPSLAAGSALPSITAAGVQLAEGSSPTQLGEQIAQSVYGGIGK